MFKWIDRKVETHLGRFLQDFWYEKAQAHTYEVRYSLGSAEMYCRNPSHGGLATWPCAEWKRAIEQLNEVGLPKPEGT